MPMRRDSYSRRLAYMYDPDLGFGPGLWFYTDGSDSCIANATELTLGLAGIFSEESAVPLARLSFSAYHQESGCVAIGGYIEDPTDGELSALRDYVASL